MKKIKYWWLDRKVWNACKKLHEEEYGIATPGSDGKPLPYIGLYGFVPELFDARMEVNDTLRRLNERGWISISRTKSLTLNLVRRQNKPESLVLWIRWIIHVFGECAEFLLTSFKVPYGVNRPGFIGGCFV